MIFIPSTGGSHNPDESTKRRFIESATKVFSDFSQTLLLEKLQDRIAVNNTLSQNTASLSYSQSKVKQNNIQRTL